MQKKFPYWFFLFLPIFILGILMRAPEVIGQNYLFGFDQGRDYMAVYKMVEERKITLIGAEVGAGSAGLTGLFHGPGYFYLLAIMYILFQGDPYGGLLLMFGFGVATLLVVFATTKKMFGTSTALISLFLVGVAPMIAPQSRFLWNHHPTSFFIAFYFYFLYKLKDNPTIYTVLSILMAGILYHFELAISVPLVILTFVTLLWLKIASKKNIILAVITVGLVFSPMIVFEVRHNFMATRGMITHLTSPSTPQNHNETTLTHMLQQRSSILIANFRDSFVFESGFIRPPHMLITMALTVLCMGIAYIKITNKQHKQFLQVLLISIIVTFAVFLPLKNAVWNYYLIHLHFVYMYVFAFTFTFLLKRFPRSIASTFGVVFMTLFMISMIKGTAQRLYTNYSIDMPDYGGKEKILGKRYIIDTVYTDANGEPFSIHIFTPPVYTYSYDYLLATYARKKYGYVPSREKKDMGYMIIEQDWTKPDSYKGWLETVIVEGQVLSEKYIQKSDHILQKRKFSE